MISKKVWIADGDTTKFLSDFIIRTEQFVRVYAYKYDAGGVEGQLQDTNSPYSYPDNLYVRTLNAPKSDDLVATNNWDLVNNNISFYTAPLSGITVWIEVGTSPEEFGDTLVQPSVEQAETAREAAELAETNALASANSASTSASNAATSETNALASANSASTSASNASTSETNASTSETNASTSEANALVSANNASTSETNASTSEANALASANSASTSETNAQLYSWEAEAEKLTTISYATEPEDSFVNIYTSDGDGTFTVTSTTEYSALHHATKAKQDAESINPEEILSGANRSIFIVSNGTVEYNRPSEAFTIGSIANTISLDTCRVLFEDIIYDIPQTDIVLQDAPIATVEVSTTTTQAYSIGDIIVVSNDIYQAITNTTSSDLLTDTNKFKVVDTVFGYDVAFLRQDKTTKLIDTKSFRTFADGIGGWNSNSNDDVATQDMFDSNGLVQLTKADDNLYEDSTYNYILLGEVPRLNQGAYHPVFNSLGSRQFSDNINWYNTTDTNNTVADCFTTISTNNTVSGRPDSLLEYQITLSNYNGFADRRMFVNKLSDFEKIQVSEEVKQDRKESKQLKAFKAIQASGSAISTNWNIWINPSNPIDGGEYTRFTHLIGKYVQTYDKADTPLSIVKVVDVVDNNNNIQIIFDTALERDESYFYPYESSNISVSSEISYTDIIGDIPNYPQSWLDYVAEGKYLSVNPLLVGQDGTSYISGTTNAIISKKSTDDYPKVSSTDNGVTWSTLSQTTVSDENQMSGNTSVGDVAVVNYKADADPLTEVTPKAITYVEPKTIASNSHSIYKGASESRVIGNGYVPTGGSYESKYLDNSILENEAISEIPLHDVLSLDNTSNGAKWFSSIAYSNNQAFLQTQGKQLIYDNVALDFGDNELFDSLTTDLNGNIITNGTFSMRLPFNK